MEAVERVVLFDGVCNYCNRWVNFIIKRDSTKRFKFATLQSSVADKLLSNHKLPDKYMDSVIYIEGAKAFTRSTATLYIARGLGFPYSLLFFFIIIPPLIRHIFYNWIATNRYKWYGKKAECVVPGPEIQDRFLS